jgi:hypothetical protein
MLIRYTSLSHATRKIPGVICSKKWVCICLLYVTCMYLIPWNLFLYAHLLKAIHYENTYPLAGRQTFSAVLLEKKIPIWLTSINFDTLKPVVIKGMYYENTCDGQAGSTKIFCSLYREILKIQLSPNMGFFRESHEADIGPHSQCQIGTIFSQFQEKKIPISRTNSHFNSNTFCM